MSGNRQRGVDGATGFAARDEVKREMKKFSSKAGLRMVTSHDGTKKLDIVLREDERLEREHEEREHRAEEGDDQDCAEPRRSLGVGVRAKDAGEAARREEAARERRVALEPRRKVLGRLEVSQHDDPPPAHKEGDAV